MKTKTTISKQNHTLNPNTTHNPSEDESMNRRRLEISQ
jgi:hypothetical protein